MCGQALITTLFKEGRIRGTFATHIHETLIHCATHTYIMYRFIVIIQVHANKDFLGFELTTSKAHRCGTASLTALNYQDHLEKECLTSLPRLASGLRS